MSNPLLKFGFTIVAEISGKIARMNPRGWGYSKVRWTFVPDPSGVRTNVLTNRPSFSVAAHAMREGGVHSVTSTSLQWSLSPGIHPYDVNLAPPVSGPGRPSTRHGFGDHSLWCSTR